MYGGEGWVAAIALSLDILLWRGRAGGVWLVGGEGIEGEVQVEDVDAGFAEEAELALGGVLIDEVGDGGCGELAGVCDAGGLVVGGGGGDVGIETGAGGGDEIYGDGGCAVLV